MNESLVTQEIVDAIDEIRRPPHNLLVASMAAVRSERRRRPAPHLAALVAASITIAIIATLVGVSALRNGTTKPSQSQAPLTSGCQLPVRTDQGPGLLETSSGIFHPAGLAAASATAYNATTKQWLPTEPQGISPNGRVVALLDQKAGHHLSLRLQTSGGRVLYSRENVMRILGWMSDGSLLVTTVDYPARLLKISADGRSSTWLDPSGNETVMWSFASGRYAWGIALPYPDPDQHREVVRLDLDTGTVSDWYAMRPESFNDSGYGPILGLTTDGFPIVPQLKTDTKAGVYVIRSKDVPDALFVASGDEISPSVFWPEDAVAAGGGLWVTTTDGELYGSAGAGGLRLVPVANSLHIYSFGGGCS